MRIDRYGTYIMQTQNVKEELCKVLEISIHYD